MQSLSLHQHLKESSVACYLCTFFLHLSLSVIIIILITIIIIMIIIIILIMIIIMNGDVQASQISEVVWILNRETLSRSWNIRIVTETKQGCESSEIIHFKKGLPQGDSLCPTLFTLCLNPIAWKLRATSGYKLSKPIACKVTHLLYIELMI